jgi:hypothetical protein
VNYPKPSRRTLILPALFGAVALGMSGFAIWLSFNDPLFLVGGIGVLAALAYPAAAFHMYRSKLKLYNKLAEVNAYFDDALKKVFTDDHRQLRDTILSQFETAKEKLPHLSEGGWDGHSMRVAQLGGALMFTLTLETFGQTDMMRLYYFRADQPVYTANDARVTGADGTVEYWRSLVDNEWMDSPHHIASGMELQELSDYLEQITQYA